MGNIKSVKLAKFWSRDEGRTDAKWIFNGKFESMSQFYRLNWICRRIKKLFVFKIKLLHKKNLGKVNWCMVFPFFDLTSHIWYIPKSICVQAYAFIVVHVACCKVCKCSIWNPKPKRFSKDGRTRLFDHSICFLAPK